MPLKETSFHDHSLASIWKHMNNIHIQKFSSIPPIDTTLLLIRDWLNSHFSSHPRLKDALTIITTFHSTPSSTFLRHNNISPDDVIRLTWHLVHPRPTIHELFLEILLETRINSSTTSMLRLIQLTWLLSPMSTNINSTNFRPIDTDPNSSSATKPHQATTPLNQHTSQNTTPLRPLMSVPIENNPQLPKNIHPTPIPLMSPPCPSTEST